MCIRSRPTGAVNSSAGFTASPWAAPSSAESMFHRSTDASKVCLLHLGARLLAGGYVLLDTQFVTPHLATLGAVAVPALGLPGAAGRGPRTDRRLLCLAQSAGCRKHRHRAPAPASGSLSIGHLRLLPEGSRGGQVGRILARREEPLRRLARLVGRWGLAYHLLGFGCRLRLVGNRARNSRIGRRDGVRVFGIGGLGRLDDGLAGRFAVLQPDVVNGVFDPRAGPGSRRTSSPRRCACRPCRPTLHPPRRTCRSAALRSRGRV